MEKAAPLRVRGLVVSHSVRWVRGSFGDEVHDRALARLAEPDRAVFSRGVSLLSWYPYPDWWSYLDVCRNEAQARRGVSPADFDTRFTEGVGGEVVKSVYRFVLDYFQLTTFFQYLPVMYTRNLEPVQIEILKNISGRLELRFAGPEGMRGFFARYMPLSLPYLARLAGATPAAVQTITDKQESGSFTLEYRFLYQPG
jgi:hypothetical protein